MNIVVVGYYRADQALSYYFDWRDAFLELRPQHQVRVINTWSRFERPRPVMDSLPLSWSLDLRAFEDVYSGRIPCDLLVYAPSFFYHNLGRRRRAIVAIAERCAHPIPTAFFVENEYRRLAEKIAYAIDLRTTFLVSQAEVTVAAPFYGTRFSGRVLSIPAGLNSAIFNSRNPVRQRPIDVGTRSHRYPPGPIGDRRNALIDAFQSGEGPVAGLTMDISTDSSARLTREEWASFLGRCRATIASEAAGCLRWNDEDEGLSVGVVSSRHYEALGCGTALLMPKGSFGGRLRAGEHYVEVDVAFPETLKEAARFIRDEQSLGEHTRKAREAVEGTDTYRHRCLDLVRAV